jgi:hypothetical protein
MPASSGDGLHTVITSAWNARSSPGEWTAKVLDWNKAAVYSPRKLSALLCGMWEITGEIRIIIIRELFFHHPLLLAHCLVELLLNQILIGPSPSPLLVTYMQYGMITRLIHPLDFFTRLNTVLSPSRPAQLNSYPTENTTIFTL